MFIVKGHQDANLQVAKPGLESEADSNSYDTTAAATRSDADRDETNDEDFVESLQVVHRQSLASPRLSSMQRLHIIYNFKLAKRFFPRTAVPNQYAESGHAVALSFSDVSFWCYDEEEDVLGASASVSNCSFSLEELHITGRTPHDEDISLAHAADLVTGGCTMDAHRDTWESTGTSCCTWTFVNTTCTSSYRVAAVAITVLLWSPRTSMHPLTVSTVWMVSWYGESDGTQRTSSSESTDNHQRHHTPWSRIRFPCELVGSSCRGACAVHCVAEA